MKPLAAFASALAALLLTGTARAQTPVPILLNYQGRVAVGTPPVNFDGSGQFRFALVNPAGTTAYWTNDGTHLDGTQPTAAVPLTVTKGLCSVLLGDTSLGAAMTAIPASVFTNADVRLRVWFDDGTNGPQLLTPDQRIAPSAYLADGSVTSAKIAPNAVGSTHIAAGAVGSTQLAAGAVQIGNIALNAVGPNQIAPGAIGSTQLDLTTIGLWTASGNNVFRNSGNVGVGTVPSGVRLDIQDNARVLGGLPYFAIKPNSWGGEASFIQGNLNVNAGGGGNYLGFLNPSGKGFLFQTPNLGTAMVIAPSGKVGIGTTDPWTKLTVSGSASPYQVYRDDPVLLLEDTSATRVADRGVSLGFNRAGSFLYGAIKGAATNSDQSKFDGYLAFFTTSENSFHQEWMRISSLGNVGIGTTSPDKALHAAFESPSVPTIKVGSGTDAQGWYAFMGNNPAGTTTSYIGNAYNHDAAAFQIRMKGTAPANAQVTVLGSGNVGIGTSNPSERLHVLGSIMTEGTGGAGRIVLKGTGVGGHQYEWYPDGPNPGDLSLFDRTAPSNGYRMSINANGNVGIGTSLPGEKLEVAGNIKISGAGNMLITPKLAITGGADMAEPFDIAGDDIPAGSVVVIDEAHPGHLKISDQPYDTRVAGIVSGAGGVNPGLTLSQQGVMEGRHQVALVGRVYARADATAHPIRPGDLLTTSATPGHLMPATDRARAQGAILGKAMTSLESGTGLVLVLVTLQ